VNSDIGPVLIALGDLLILYGTVTQTDQVLRSVFGILGDGKTQFKMSF